MCLEFDFDGMGLRISFKFTFLVYGLAYVLYRKIEEDLAIRQSQSINQSNDRYLFPEWQMISFRRALTHSNASPPRYVSHQNDVFLALTSL
jgi:hypothetical protein